jgi:hypothetical protein
MSSFLTKSSTETDNQRAVTRAEVLMCELIAKYIIYISISLYEHPPDDHSYELPTH